MLFFTTVSVTLGILLKEPAKTWIASAFFLILSSLLLKADFGLGSVERFFFAKLTNAWQRFFDFELQLQAIAIDSLALCLYTLLVALGGMYLFTKQDVG